MSINNLTKQLKMLESQLNTKKSSEAALKKELDACKTELAKQKEANEKLKGKKSVANEEVMQSRGSSKGKINVFKKTMDIGKKVEISIFDEPDKKPTDTPVYKPSTGLGKKLDELATRRTELAILEDQLQDFEEIEKALMEMKEMKLEKNNREGFSLSGDVEKQRNKSVSGKSKLRNLKK